LIGNNELIVISAAQGRIYGYDHPGAPHQQGYIQPLLDKLIATRTWSLGSRALDYGCGNGWFTGWLRRQGFEAIGVDPSDSGICVARAAYPDAQFSTDVSRESLERLGPFDLVVCLEVIAHCFAPTEVLQNIYHCLKPGGMLVLSTPYHSYIKDLAMAVTGKLEAHLNTLWSGGFVHFFTIRSIGGLLYEVGFENIGVRRAGRIPPLAKTMVLSCMKPR
jgi:2-polyprenyl-6-hydroxyphenyl methylase/3-demethylubiquinone-9 3-methyltransferase